MAQCPVCQRNKSLATTPAGLLQLLPIPERIWEDIAIDFIEGLLKSNGSDTILVVVDRLSKYSHFIAMSHPFTAKTTTTVFMREIVRLHGFPRTIVSDRDKIFVSRFWSELFRAQGTQLRQSTAYHPQTDGQSERVNKCLETYLRCFCNEIPRLWGQWLAWAEFWYNTHIMLLWVPLRSVWFMVVHRHHC